MTKNKPIGQILKELHLITEDQLDVALKVQQVNEGFLGQVLQDLNFITSKDIAIAIAIQQNMEFVDIENITPSKEALKLVPLHIALAQNILPLSIDDTHFVVATEEINDLKIQDYLRKISNRRVKFVVGDKHLIKRYTELYYHQLKNPIDAEIQTIVKEVKSGQESNIPYLATLLLNNAIKDKATDIHITPGDIVSHIFYRIDGVLQYYYSIPSGIHQQLTAHIKILSNMDISEQRTPQDGSFSHNFLNNNFDFRVSTLPTNYGENIVLRLLSKNTLLFDLEALGLSKQDCKKIENYFLKPYGMVLVVGPTGSGKTTTLYSALRKIDSLKKNIMTIEDPIEYKFSFIKQTQLNEKSGYSYSAAIRAFMRQDPDVILVGEIRDAQTAELAIRASLTGHLVLSTLHTNDAVGTIPRLSDLGIPTHLVASGLLSVIAQRLVRKLCPHCKKPIQKSSEALLNIGVSKRIIEQYPNPTLFEAVGCELCHHTGYSGRQAIVEILDIDEDIQTMIVANATTQELSHTAYKKGMYKLKEDAYAKVLTGITSLDEVARVVI